MNVVVSLFVRAFVRWMPDAFTVTVLLTLLTWILAVGVASYPPRETLVSWGDSFWDLLRFTNQITLTLLLGYTFANTPAVKRVLLRSAGLARTPASAYALACLLTGLCALFSWGLSLIAAGILARAIGAACRAKGVVVHYPLLVASSFSGFVVWHQGLSSSVGLTIATPGHFLADAIGVVPISETLFTGWNVTVALVVLATLPFVMASLRPRDAGEIQEIPDHLLDDSSPAAAPPEPAAGPDGRTPANRMDDSRLPTFAIVCAGGAFLIVHFVTRGRGLDLNTLNLGFLVLGMLLAGSTRAYVDILTEGGRVAAPLLLHYPFYAGIAGIMADSGLAQMVVELFLRVSSPETLPLFGFLSGGVLNLFIPSGGGQWAVQGPIMIAAAQEIGVAVPRVAMAVALGDQWTNLLQPLVIVPVMAIAGLSVREVMGYMLFAVAWTGLVFAGALALG